MLCQMCERLNVEDLMALKRTNDDNNKGFGAAGYKYWEHYRTVRQLKAAAKYCELCDLIVRYSDDWRWEEWGYFLKNNENIDLVIFIAAKQYPGTKGYADEHFKAHFDKEVFDSLVFARKILPRASQGGGYEHPASGWSRHGFVGVALDLETPRGIAS
jgi:hypothetical protein